MAVNRLPSGRWRAQVYDPATGKLVSAAKILGSKGASFKTEREARNADAQAYALIARRAGAGITVAEWRERWLTDPLFTSRRPKESTRIHNEERTRRFAATYGDLPLGGVTDEIVATWIAGGRNTSTVAVLKAMFNDATSAEAGRILAVNPFAGLRLRKSRGRADETPPTEEQVREMIAQARKLTCPSFAHWLKVSAFVGMRPGEMDALKWDWVDFDAGRIDVKEQWNVKTRSFTLPKNGLQRMILLTPPAREALLETPRESAFCFVNMHGGHWTPSGRSHHWDRVRTAMGWLEVESRKALYLCTRHYCGWYLYNILELPAEDVAIQLGHTDGGELVRRVYGHRDKERALGRIDAAFDRVSNVVPLRSVKEGA